MSFQVLYCIISSVSLVPSDLRNYDLLIFSCDAIRNISILILVFIILNLKCFEFFLQKMAETGDSVFGSLKEFVSDRFWFVEKYHKFIDGRHKPLSWSDSDVDAFIACDPVHGPAVCILLLSTINLFYFLIIVSSISFKWVLFCLLVYTKWVFGMVMQHGVAVSGLVLVC